MIAEIPKEVTGELKWIKLGKTSRHFFPLCASSEVNKTFPFKILRLSFLAESGTSLEKEIVWNVIVFTPENAKQGTTTNYRN